MVLWNSLPSDIRQSSSLNVFKSKLKNIMILIVVLSKFYFAFIHGFLVK